MFFAIVVIVWLALIALIVMFNHGGARNGGVPK